MVSLYGRGYAAEMETTVTPPPDINVAHHYGAGRRDSLGEWFAVVLTVT